MDILLGAMVRSRLSKEACKMARGQIEKRGVRRRSIKPVILIVTEGSQTEPKYFEHFRTRKNNVDIRVVGSRSSAG